MSATAITGQRRHKRHNPGWYYVEHAITKPDGNVLFRAHIDEAASRYEAEEAARSDAKRAHRDATEIDFYMSRIVSEDRALKIIERMISKDWDGWPLGK